MIPNLAYVIDEDVLVDNALTNDTAERLLTLVNSAPARSANGDESVGDESVDDDCCNLYMIPA
ncbi:MAG: hypothetical protein AAF918_13480 [Pseudomonadota bacterium]